MSKITSPGDSGDSRWNPRPVSTTSALHSGDTWRESGDPALVGAIPLSAESIVE
jgi:hypothetical protein